VGFVQRHGRWAVIAGASTELGAAATLRSGHGVEVRALVLDLGRADVGELVAAACRPTSPSTARRPTVLLKRFGPPMVERGRGDGDTELPPQRGDDERRSVGEMGRMTSAMWR